MSTEQDSTQNAKGQHTRRLEFQAVLSMHRGELLDVIAGSSAAIEPEEARRLCRLHNAAPELLSFVSRIADFTEYTENDDPQDALDTLSNLIQMARRLTAKATSK